MAGKLKITLKKSVIGSVPKHRRTVKALGFKRTQTSVIHDDSPQIRGMVNSICHLVECEEVQA